MNKQYDPKKHHRRSIRLKHYDYSKAGFYFVTICIKHHTCLLGKITNGEMILNEAGKMIENEWLKLTERFLNIELHESVVMPNHFHGIIEILDTWKTNDGKEVIAKNGQILPINTLQTSQNEGPSTNHREMTIDEKRLGNIVGAFESITTVEYIKGVKEFGWKRFDGKLWQRNYWEHIIRHQRSFNNIATYILNNVSTWEKDKFYRPNN